MLVAVEYFTKWVEAGALSSTRQEDVINMISYEIICHFRVAREVVTVRGEHIEAFLADLNIQHCNVAMTPSSKPTIK